MPDKPVKSIKKAAPDIWGGFFVSVLYREYFIDFEQRVNTIF